MGALDKAEEIKVRAKEECGVEALKMEEKEKAKLREEFKEKLKRVEIEHKIQKQKMIDTYRMELLRTRDAKLQELVDSAKSRFSSITKDKAKYKKFLEESLIQGIFKIWDEDEITVQCR